MPQEKLRYLEVFESNGDWISRPDYYILATLLEPEFETVFHTYSSMLLEDKLRPSPSVSNATQFGKRLETRFKNNSLSKKRETAGHVMFELVRIASETGQAPSLNSAYSLAAHWYHTEHGTGTTENSERKTRAAFSTFRDIAHLLAAYVYDPNLVADLEGNEKSVCRFLGLAKGFELFFDNNVSKTNIPWKPYRIPQKIEPIYSIEFDRLTREELNLI